jgi:hypothetical protein
MRASGARPRQNLATIPNTSGCIGLGHESEAGGVRAGIVLKGIRLQHRAEVSVMVHRGGRAQAVRRVSVQQPNTPCHHRGKCGYLFLAIIAVGKSQAVKLLGMLDVVLDLPDLQLDGGAGHHRVIPAEHGDSYIYEPLIKDGKIVELSLKRIERPLCKGIDGFISVVHGFSRYYNVRAKRAMRRCKTYGRALGTVRVVGRPIGGKRNRKITADEQHYTNAFQCQIFASNIPPTLSDQGQIPCIVRTGFTRIIYIHRFNRN